MRKLVEEWVDIKKDVDSIDWKGRHIRLTGVPAQFNPKRKATRIFIDDVLKAENEYIAKENTLDPRQINQLMLLFAESSFFKGGYMKQTFRFNKMLFMFWQDMMKKGYENYFTHDEFGSARAGPVPKNFKPLMKDLEKKGLVKVKWSHRHGISSEFNLTDKGQKVAKNIWNSIPDDIKLLILKVKQDLFLVDATELKDIIHEKYPEYKRTYVDLDKED